ncbi:sugar phosphate isomerase [Dactylonectria estremocensis]|uniref:Sugar phosphate isomerase n=1 Tax=Dactylonectria estremocensis TaxID=1079267 RepID=A0A9P9D1I4_9HYPO|nr:sugar phosphate isomerase [Dactylonectria estremocensis]
MPLLPAIASPSLGNANVHSIDEKLKQASIHGFKLIEIVEQDLLVQARKLEGGVTDSNQVEAAKYVKSLCNKEGIKPFVLQPFCFYEGLLDRREHEAKIDKLKLWMELAKVLDVQVVQVPSNWLREGTTGDIDVIVKDLVEMAEIGLQQDPVVSFAYEAVAWGTPIDTWEGAWDVVKRVNKPNFGLCLDTYHIVARVWGDPTIPGCKVSTGDIDLQRSMVRLVKDVDVEKIFYVQLGDAERLNQLLIAGHPFYSKEQLPRMSWSRNARLFAFEATEDGCLPLEPVVDAVMKGLKYKGFISMETFSKKLFDDDPEIPKLYAAKAMKSWNEMVKRLK